MKQVCTSRHFNDVFLFTERRCDASQTLQKETKFALRVDEFISRGKTITRRNQLFPCMSSFQLPFSLFCSPISKIQIRFFFLKTQMHGGGAAEVK